MTQNDTYGSNTKHPYPTTTRGSDNGTEAYCHNVERLAYDPALDMTLQSRHLVI